MNLLAIPLLAFLAAVQGPPADGAHTLRFSLDRQGAAAMQYTVELDEASGAGTYAAGHAAGEPVRIQVSAPVLKKLIAVVPVVKAQRCESHVKGIAQTGKKTVRYAGEGPPVECSYNYSDDDRLNNATNVFEAIAETMQYGDRLRAKLRFDRLGLDAEVDGLVHALAEGRAMEVLNIAPVLKSITDDDRVMERVRRKAARLLEADATQARAASDASDR